MKTIADQTENTGEYLHRDDAPTTQLSQNLTFHNSIGGETVDYGGQDNWIARADGTPSIELGKFLSRPTRIASFSWSAATASGIVINDIDPWFEFLNNSVIKRKIENFAFLRGDLHIKVTVNASPFYFGLARTYYCPMQKPAQFERINYTNASIDMKRVQSSQHPGVYILPHANVGGDIVAPFFFTKNWLDLFGANEVRNMGRLYTMVEYPLDTANGVSAPALNVQIFAWMENVELMGPTISATLQAERVEEDEFVGDGQISGPASAVASIASKMRDIPVIGRFAQATSLGATAIGKIASLWGFTNAPVIKDVHSFIPRNMPALASSEIGIGLEKLTLDPKQELSIDPSLVGIPSSDELSISYLNTKESLLTVAQWKTSDLVDSLIFNVRAEPCLGASAVLTGPPAQTLGALTVQGYIAGLFQYWRGDLIFRIQVIGTKFHKGRLRVSYDPVGEIGTNADSINAVFTHIVDIGEENNIEFKIPWHQSLAWKSCRTPAQTIGDGSYSTSPLTQSPGHTNGLLTIRVLNTLTAPVSTSSIGLAIFVRGGENLEFAVPIDITPQNNNTMLSFKSAQSQRVTEKGSVDTMENVVTQVIIGSSSNMPHDKRYLQNFGEVVPSLRKLLRRSSLLEYISLDDVTATSLAFWKATWPLTTPVPGYANDGMHAATGGAINFVPMHPITYIRYMFSAWKGGMRYHIQVAPCSGASMDDVTVFRVTTGTTNLARASTALTTNLTDRSARASFLMSTAALGAGAATVTSNRQQSGISIECPYYTAYNFSLNTVVDNTTGPSVYSYDFANQFGIQSFLDPANSGAANLSQVSVKKYASIGPDWNVYFFVSIPTLYLFTTPTVP